MKNTILFITLFCFFFTAAHAQEGDYVENQLLAKFKANAAGRLARGSNWTVSHQDVQVLSRRMGGIEKMELLDRGTPKNGPLRAEAPRTVVITFSKKQNIPQAIETLMATGLFEYVEPNYIVHGELTPDDPYFNGSTNPNKQWGLHNDGTLVPGLTPTMNVTEDADIDAPEAWDIETGASRTDLVVAIIDTGVRLTHEDLSKTNGPSADQFDRRWVNADETGGNSSDDDGNGFADDINGWDFVNGDNNPSDDHGHGSNVAGIAIAQGDNGSGISGVIMKNAKVMACKVLNSSNSGTVDNLVAGMNYARNNGAHIMNVSVSTTSFSTSLRDAVDNAHKAGIVVVAAMGSANESSTRYPAAFAHTIAVGATEADDSKYSLSVYAPYIDLVAPGRQIWGLGNGSNAGYAWYSGTSQATPIVAGIAGLLLSKYSTLKPAQIKRILQRSSEDQKSPETSEDVAGFDIYHGYGRANAYLALLNATAYGSISSYPHIEDFETDPGGWVAGNTNTVSVVPSWAWGAPVGSTINSASHGAKAWATNLSGNYNNGEWSYIESPVYDFSSLNDPLVKFDYWADIESGDGALLQYTTDDGNTWTTVGANADPYNWYNTSSATALNSAGLGSDGWAGSTGGWKTAAHTLTSLAGQARVQFRIFFAADGSSGTSTMEGVAIDKFTVEDATIYTSSWSNGTPTASTAAVISGNHTTTASFACNDLLMDASLTIANGHTVSVADDVFNEANISASAGSTFALNGTAYPQSISGSFANLTINNGNGVSLSAATSVAERLSLTNGTLTTGGFLTLKATQTTTAYLVAGAGVLSGTATMERYVRDNSAESWGATGGIGYRYFSSPINGATVASFAGFTPDLTKAADYNTNYATVGNPNFPNIFMYDESRITGEGVDFLKGWMVPTASSDALPNGKGFIANINTGITASMTGTFNTGDVAASISRGSFTSSGWNLLGNPYPAPIDFDAFKADNAAIDGAVYMRIATSQYGGIWASYVSASGIESPDNVIDNGYIAPMSGFMVRKSAAGDGTVTFKEAHQIDAGAGVTVLREQSQLAGLVRLEIGHAGRVDETVVYFSENATAQIDAGYDAFKLQYNSSGWPTLFTKVESNMLSINALPVSNEDVSQPIHLWADSDGLYQLKASELAHFANTTEVYLEDKAAGQFINLRTDAYSVQLPKGMHSERFVLHIRPARVTGIDQDLAGAGISLYASGRRIYLQMNAPSALGLSIVDLAGKTVASFQKPAHLSAWQLDAQLPDGTYIIRLHHESGVFAKKVYLGK